MLTSGALLLLVALAVVVTPQALGEPAFFAGTALVFVVTGFALLFPWTPHNKDWSILLPIADIVAIVAIREGIPQLGAGLFLVFPVIWMARNYRLRGVITGVALSTVLLWVAWGLTGRSFSVDEFRSLVLIPIVLAFIAATTYSTTQRSTGQRELLRSQAALTEEAFSRARAQENYLHEILNAVEFGVIAFNHKGEVTLINDSHRQSLTTFGYARSAIVHADIVQADQRTPFPPNSRPFSRALAGQTFENVVVWVGKPDQRQVAFSVTARGLTTPLGEPGGGVIVLRDVTAELEAIAARDNLIASVSHELRTPLTSILGYLELALDDDELRADTHRMVDVAHRNSERLLSLVTDLLSAASDADTSLTVTVQECDLAEIARQSVEDLQVAASARPVTLVLQSPNQVSASVDPLRIRQVIDNLLSNAIKYNRSGGKVTLSIEPSAQVISIHVTDTGVGLAPDELSHLFDRFYRTESARQSSVQGSGLGMGIVRDIVRQHGGDLTVSSEVGVGSTFSFVVPAGTSS
ncbi:MAG TPA: ATP-binding protein [Glaciihabitans sp.]|nr:ATP-binding protein [Glaciihabitans sp.]